MHHRTPPVVPGLPLLGNAIAFYKNPIEVFRRGFETYGSIFSIRLGPKPAAVVIGPENHRFFFTETKNVFSIREIYKFIIPMFGKVTLSAEPDEYSEQREILHPAFDSSKMDSYVDVMVRESAEWLDGLETDGEFDLWGSFEQLSMYIAASALMGRDFRKRFGAEFWALYRDVARGMEFVLPTNLPLPRFRRRDRAKQKLLAMIGAIVAERRRCPQGQNDFVQMLAEASYSNKQPVPVETIGGMILILVFAAYETTAAQTCWALTQLLQHPSYLERVLAEQEEVLGNEAESISVETLRQLTWLDLALKETERMCPITTMLWRHTARDYELGGYFVPKGWVTIVCPPIAHRLPEVFSNPDDYDPERFSPERAEDRKEPFGMVNYGGGFHKCLGVNFARNEMKTILSMLLQRYRLALGQQSPRPDYSTGICRPHSPYPIKYRKRV
jgi:sterol 14-demethylase